MYQYLENDGDYYQGNVQLVVLTVVYKGSGNNPTMFDAFLNKRKLAKDL